VIFSQPPPVQATAVIKAGTLYLTGSSLDFTVTDATGSARGWHVTAAVSGGTATLESMAYSCGALARECPVSSLSYPLRLVPGHPVVIAGAAPGSGMAVTAYTGLQWLVTGNAVVSVSAEAGS